MPQSEQESLIEQEALIEQQVSLFESVAQGKSKKLADYLAEGGDPNQQDPDNNHSTLLTIGAEHGHYGLVEQLLQHPRIAVSKANELGNTPLMVAAGKGYEAMVARLLESGASQKQVNRDGMNPLMFAAQNGHLAVMNQLIQALPPEAIATITEQADLNGRTALILAAQKQQDQVVQFLLDQGANVHHQDGYGMNGLMYAVHQGNLPLTRLLARFGATAKNKGELGIDAKDDHGHTALENAALLGGLKTAQCLLEVGASLKSSLSCAAFAGQLEMVQWLVQNGADVDKGDNDGHSPASSCVKRSS